MTFIETSSVLILMSISGLFGFWLRKKITLKEKEDIQYRANKLETFSQLLDIHSKKFLSIHVKGEFKPVELTEQHLKMISNMMLWTSDKVLSEYVKYFEKLNPEAINKLEEREIYFGKTVLAFRIELGYKNTGLLPEHVAILFKWGWRKGII